MHHSRRTFSSPLARDLLSISSGKRFFHRSRELNLNRFLFDPCEVNNEEDDHHSEGESSCTAPYAILPKSDYRTVHAAKILNLQNGDSIRAGIVGGGINEDPGFVTDEAVITWLPEGKIKKAQPTKNGDPPGSLNIRFESLSTISPKDDSSISSPVSLILALPRPLQLGRILPMVAQLGVDHLVLCSAQKVPKDYFGSHLFRKPEELRKLLIEGLCQAGDVRLPKITIVRSLKKFLEDDLDRMFPCDSDSNMARVIAHPLRKTNDGNDLDVRMRDIVFPSTEALQNVQQDNTQKGKHQILLAVGPEGGWAEDYEIDLFKSHGFQQITLGPRILRSDVAVVSLLSLGDDVCNAADRRQT